MTRLIIAKIRSCSKDAKEYKIVNVVRVVGLNKAPIITDIVLIPAVKAHAPKDSPLLSPNLPASIAAIIGAIKYPKKSRKVSNAKIPENG